MSEKTLTRMDLSEAVFREVGLSRNESAQLVESVLQHMSDALAGGETVKISLRGFAKKEWVRIRWRQDGAWVEIGWIYTSNTGSGELWIPVPAGAADGGNSVRGDGPSARAQTNAVTISGGPAPALASEAPEPTPVPPLAATPEPEIDEPPATPDAESTAEPALDGTPIPESP